MRSGYENINLDYANKNGILLFYTPGRNVDAVADSTIGLIICECRNIARWGALSAIMACIPADRRVRPSKMRALQSLGIKPHPERNPPKNLRRRLYQTRPPDPFPIL